MPSRNRSREQAKARQRAELEAEGISPDKKKKKAGKRAKGRRSTSGQAGKSKPGASDEKSQSSGGGRSRRPPTGPMHDPSAGDDADVRFVMAGDAVKTYLCPGCNRDISPGTGHIVAVPPDAPDLRRHWHKGCWEHRHTRF